MFHHRHFRLYGKLACLLPGVLAIAMPSPARGQAAEKKDSAPQLRIICVASLSEDQEVILASRDEKGVWQEYRTLKLRSPFITDWIPAKTGELHLALRGSKELVSICRFTYPNDAQRALLVLLADSAKQGYLSDVINPAKMKFAKGSTLLVNYSATSGTVMLGSRRASFKPGEHLIVKPEPEANGMFRMLVAYTGKANELVPCHDRYVPYSDKSRDLLLLFPDPVLRLRTFSLPEFGPFD
jgi:hypothetical protein